MQVCTGNYFFYLNQKIALHDRTLAELLFPLILVFQISHRPVNSKYTFVIKPIWFTGNDYTKCL